ncbi:hypothetical protein C8046_08090 [Serinibacter arcticus]|uniref:Mycothiol-dependent maleylpyruvate isomerase metal-binding domain-containing protein n=1 Tax=Serinibacter arcticus TaxID=1655435 RepID=A0A2U1ZUG6_9MICO|nr:maleylpyruvate isomerase N-terminal domain-containing protein [Serinibacter arcticus]PWD50618.1 hypothetical protein C8046_08090 [Serinibacter arcticus]
MSDIAVDPALLDADLAEQSSAVVDWLRTLDDDVFDTSALPDWRVRDLVAHLGQAMTVLAGAEAADGEQDVHGDERRHDLASYLASYADNAAGIHARAVELAQEHAADPVGDVEEKVGLAVANLTRLRADGVSVVRVRRGLIPLTSLVLTRLVELVVHADDLARAVHVTTPVDPTARTIVAQQLLAILRRRSGYELDVVDERAWVRLATGRITWDERGTALRPGNLSEGLPDLRPFLPLL